MCKVGKVVNENTSQLSGILVTKGAIKAQLIFIYFFQFVQSITISCVYLFYSFIYLFIFST